MKQKRRTFIKQSAVIGLGLPFLGCSSEMKQTVMKSKYLDTIGLQLWTVRNQLQEDFEGTIQKIAAQGYKQVETFRLEQVEKIYPMLNDLGMKIYSTHIPSAHFTGRWEFHGGEPKSFDKMLEDAEKKGIKHMVVAWLDAGERSLDDYKRLAEGFNNAGEKTKAAGITLSYHNHNFEFAEVEGVQPYELLMKEFDPKYAQFELDVFWASTAGLDPIELMKRMKGKVSLLHLKDKKEGTPDSWDTGDVPRDAFKELGNGVVDLKKIIEMAEETGVEYCFVEQDESADPLASTKTSLDWLKKTV